MAAPLINLAEPFFLKVLGLVNQPGYGADQLPQLQRQLKDDIKILEQKVISRDSSVTAGDEWKLSKRVLVYWADEVLTNYLSDWQDFVLEHEYYGERNRAWKFYVEAEQNKTTMSSETAELFYLAVVLGFVGDIEGAFKYELQTELPGRKADLNEARRFWAMELQARIRHEAGGNLQGEPLDGDVDPLHSDRVLKTGFAMFLLSCLALLIVSGWWALKEQQQSEGYSDSTEEQSSQP